MAVARLPPLQAYPERVWPVPGMLEQFAIALAARVRASATASCGRQLLAVAERALAEGETLRSLDDRSLRRSAREAGAALRADRKGADQTGSDAALAAVLARVAEASARVLGQRPFPPQLQAAAACMRGMLAEMATGEGKTLAGTLAASAIALTGTPVHLVTVNRYLCERDHAFAVPLHGFLGLTSGAVTEATTRAARMDAYRSDVTVVVNKDLAFDYMRDRLAAGRHVGPLRRKAASLRHPNAPLLLRGLYHAIVDEADSVLVDEARTPLILSAEGARPYGADVFDRALALADSLTAGTDYILLDGERRAVLQGAGRARLRAEAAGIAGSHRVPPWDVAEEREALIEQALTARHLLLRDEHYLLRDGAAQIIDEFSGRVLPDRTWNDGLQELVERKEGLDLSKPRVTEARMTYQRFFRRYQRLSGLSGTLNEVSGELWRVYRVRVARIPTFRPDRKTLRPLRCHRDEAAKWREVTREVQRHHAAGVPVLVGTRTLGASEQVAAALARAGVPHRVLNADQDAAEAEIIAAAGLPGAVTVATNMAGRGTDIRVGRDVAARGGLRVVVSEPHEAGRIDRQLVGRCGRQGQPGEALRHVSLDDALLVRHAPLARAAARLLFAPTGGRSAGWAAHLAQRRSEALHAGMRRDLLRADAWVDEAIAFAGRAE